jgi:hypothetical protein
MRTGAVIALALALAFLLFWPYRNDIQSGANDFLQFYAGGRLAFTGDLYDGARVREVQLEALGKTSDVLRFTRLPYLAALLWPLARLPYQAAWALWIALGAAALVAFCWLWPRPAAVAACLSVPALVGLANGQDVTFLLLWIGAAVALEHRGRPFAAGLVLSLCASKPHLFALLPLLLIAQRRWRLATGLAAGAAAVLALSFAAGGLRWPLQFYDTVTNPAIHARAGFMPNLHGLLRGIAALEGLLAAGVVAAHWRVVRRASFEYGLAATLTGGLLLSYHAYLADCVVLLPAALEVLAAAGPRALRLLAAFLISPLPYFLHPSLPMLVPLGALALLGGMAFTDHYGQPLTLVRPAPPPPPTLQTRRRRLP